MNWILVPTLLLLDGVVTRTVKARQGFNRVAVDSAVRNEAQAFARPAQRMVLLRANFGVQWPDGRKFQSFNIGCLTGTRRSTSFHDVAMKLVHMPSRQAVRAAIAASLQHNGAPLQWTASHLGVSARSLQRHLAMMGTSYSEIVVEVRLDKACRLLAETNEHISRIALSLGYAGASSFSRTFMRMMKVQPGTYRKQNSNCRPAAKVRG